MQIAMKVYVEDEYYDETLVGVVNITPEFAKKCLNYMMKVKALRSNDGGIWSLTRFDYSVDYLAIDTEEKEELFEKIESDPYYTEVNVNTDEGYELQSMEEKLLYIFENSIKWDGYLKHTTIRVYTTGISKEFLQTIAGK